MDIERPRQNYGPSQNKRKLFLLQLKEIMLRPEFRIIFLCLAWFVLSRANTQQQFFPSFLLLCIALLQFRLSGYGPKTAIPSLVGNIGVIWYVFWIAASLFAGLYGGLLITLSPESTPLVTVSVEFILLRQMVYYLFGTTYFPLLYIWLGTLFVALFDWSFMLSIEEKDATSQIKKNRLRPRKKKELKTK